MGKIKLYRVLILLVICVIPVIWGFCVEPNLLIVNKVELSVPRWHKEFNNLKIVVISDIHAGSPFIDSAKLDEIVKLTNEQKPDLIFLLGDYVIQGIGHFIEPNIIADKLSNLKPSKGIIAVLGNHDWWYDGFKVKKALENKHIIVLENNAMRIKYAGKYLWIAGVGDYWTRPVKIKDTIKTIKNNDTIILLSHNPDVFPNVSSRISLTLSGHVHGGQVYIPFIGRIVAPSEYGKRYARGHVVENNRHLFVSSGIGTSILPVRFGTPPEIVVLHIKGK